MKIILATIALHTICIRYAQSQNTDTSAVILNAKMILLEIDPTVKSFDFHKGYLEYTPEFEFLKSDGFAGKIIFLKIKVRPFVDTTSINPNGGFNSYFPTTNYDFIFGYNTITTELYRLKGLAQNDFILMYDYISHHPIFEKSCFSSGGKFTDCFQVDELDLNCLIKSVYKRNKGKPECMKKAPPIYNGVVY